jgi:hypothetical protein
LLKAPRAPWVDEKAASIQVGWEPEIPKNSYLTKNCITEKVQKERKMKKIDLFTNRFHEKICENLFRAD